MQCRAPGDRGRFALRHIGFKNIFVLKGGAVSLVNCLSPKNAY